MYYTTKELMELPIVIPRGDTILNYVLILIEKQLSLKFKQFDSCPEAIPTVKIGMKLIDRRIILTT